MNKFIAKIILINNSTILLQHRDNKLDIPFPGYWSLLGGEIAENETPSEAIIREVKEEVGIDIETPKFICKQGRIEGEINVIDYIFLNYIDIPLNKMKLTEGQEIIYYDINSINKINIVPHYKNIILKTMNELF